MLKKYLLVGLGFYDNSVSINGIFIAKNKEEIEKKLIEKNFTFNYHNILICLDNIEIINLENIKDFKEFNLLDILEKYGEKI